MAKISLTIVVLAKNAEKFISRAIESATFAEQILVLDDSSTDNTAKLAKKIGARVISAKGRDFAEKRNLGLENTHTEWFFYLDADEVITPDLEEQIRQIVSSATNGAYKVKRRNVFLGKEMYSDYVDRLFHKSVISGWQGKVHESPILSVYPGVIEAPLLHYTHSSIESMLTKTNQWSEYEADLRLTAQHPPVAWWRLIRIGVTFFLGNYLGKKLWKYGREGLFEAFFQMIDKLIVYTKLWERQLFDENRRHF